MVRIAALLPILLLFLPSPLRADGETDPRLARAMTVQKAMTQARDHLQAKQPAEAVAVLEAEILYVNGNETYLALMKDAYVAYLKDLQRTKSKGSAERIEHVGRQLRILDPKWNGEAVVASDGVATVPEPPPPAATTETKPTTVVRVQTDADPFLQSPLDRESTPDVKAKAKIAFEQKQYAEAAALFQQAQAAGLSLTPEQRQAWGYCRLHVVVARLNRGGDADPSVTGLRKEAEDAMRLGGPALARFGDEVLAEIAKRKPDSPREASAETVVPAGWQVSETGNFRIFFQKTTAQAPSVAKAAEKIRTANFEKWSGPAGAEWAPRCDIWLHQTGNDYAEATHQPTTSPGHASVGIKDGHVHNRRIDLRLDDLGLLEATLPREVAYVVVADLFSEQPLPRWSVVGMSVLAETPAEVSRYLRAVPKLTQEKKLFAMRELLKLAEFPDTEKITPFYVESVSLVDYLVRLKGAKAFALYLREAPRRGYEEALQRHYGFKDANELQERWLQFAMKGE